MSRIYQPKYFTLQEFLFSQTAIDKGIVQFPEFSQIELFRDVCRVFLDPLREEWGRPIYITSGYRGRELNAAVGGVVNSYHRYLNGRCAVDISAGSPYLTKQLYKKVCEWDNVLDECYIGTSDRYIHVGIDMVKHTAT